MLVRVRGIDAPELRGDCDSEKRAPRMRRRHCKPSSATGAVLLTAIEGDKFFGRVVADMATRRATMSGGACSPAGFARVYDGGPRGGWCGIGAADGAGTPARASLAD